MVKILIIMLVSLLSGCSQKYYDSTQAMNIAIAESNQARAEACRKGLIESSSEAQRLALVLTICLKEQKFIPVQAPERPSDIIRSIGTMITPLGIVGFMAGMQGPAYNVGGDYVQNSGEGSAGTHRPVTHPTHVILKEIPVE
jgi:hypothetical protein